MKQVNKQREEIGFEREQRSLSQDRLGGMEGQLGGTAGGGLTQWGGSACLSPLNPLPSTFQVLQYISHSLMPPPPSSNKTTAGPICYLPPHSFCLFPGSKEGRKEGGTAFGAAASASSPFLPLHIARESLKGKSNHYAPSSI